MENKIKHGFPSPSKSWMIVPYVFMKYVMYVTFVSALLNHSLITDPNQIYTQWYFTSFFCLYELCPLKVEKSKDFLVLAVSILLIDRF
jgi:hypothetical protein